MAGGDPYFPSHPSGARAFGNRQSTLRKDAQAQSLALRLARQLEPDESLDRQRQDSKGLRNAKGRRPEH